jgi:gas vesicle protein
MAWFLEQPISKQLKRNIMKTKFLVLAAIAAAVLLAFSTDKGEEMRGEWAEDAKKLKKKLKKMAGDAGGQIGDLKATIAKQVEGLGSDVRDRIMAILDEGTSKAKDAKNKVAKEVL